ncbi:hypothetical protein pb186bvf_014721 [Paramecium bursaria]
MGPYLSEPNKEKVTVVGEGKNILYAASKMQGWCIKMEASYITMTDLINDVSVFGIFDGHGGKEVAQFVQQHFLLELLQNKNFQEFKFEEALKKSFLKMDELLNCQAGQQVINLNKGLDYVPSYAGCAAIVSLIHKNTLYVANAGHSRAVLCRNNLPFEMSFDHRPENPEEKKRIQKAGGTIIEGRINGNINLSRALGCPEYKSNLKLGPTEQLIIAVPDIMMTELDFTKDKFILMGCDGIFQTLDNSSLLDYVNKNISQGKVDQNALKLTAESLLNRLLGSDVSSISLFNDFVFTKDCTGCNSMTTIIIYFNLK